TVKSGAGKDGDEDDDEYDDDDDKEEELAKNDEEDKETGKGGDEARKSGGESEEEEETSEEEEGSFDPIPRTPEDSEKESDDEEEHDVGVESIFTTTSSQIVSLEPPTPIMTPSTIATITTSGKAPIPPPRIPSIILENLPTFNSAFCFEERLRLLETSFAEYRQTNQFANVVSAIPGIVHQYIDQQMKEAVREAVKEQVSRILPRIEESINATLEAKVLTRSSHSSRTSYAIAADLSEMELKKILIEKMEGNKSIQRSDEQRNLYKALVEAYEADKPILDTYGDSTILKRGREDDDQEGPSAGPNRGSKRQKEGGEQASASTPSEKATKGAGGSTTGSQSRQQSTSESVYAEEPVQTTCQMEETPLLVYETGADD
nr:hypothetical protein [Tanacetum cinerariifolium]